jgi:chemotaxis signal transduction protein
MEQSLSEVGFKPENNISETEATHKVQLASACLVEYAHGQSIALSPHTTYGLIEHPEFVSVPGSASYAYGLMTWQHARIPLLNLEILLNSESYFVNEAPPRYALIVAYQSIANYPISFGAIGLNTLPQTILVGDDEQCSLPDDRKIWQELALSCFQHDGYTIPILDTAKLFSSYHRVELS